MFRNAVVSVCDGYSDHHLREFTFERWFMVLRLALLLGVFSAGSALAYNESAEAKVFPNPPRMITDLTQIENPSDWVGIEHNKVLAYVYDYIVAYQGANGSIESREELEYVTTQATRGYFSDVLNFSEADMIQVDYTIKYYFTLYTSDNGYEIHKRRVLSSIDSTHLRNAVTEIYAVLENDITELAAFSRALDTIHSRYAHKLSTEDKFVLETIISIGKNSAQYWVDNIGDWRKIPRVSPPAVKMGTGRVIAADVGGGTTGAMYGFGVGSFAGPAGSAAGAGGGALVVGGTASVVTGVIEIFCWFGWC